jgi:hypothetical protein
MYITTKNNWQIEVSLISNRFSFPLRTLESTSTMSGRNLCLSCLHSAFCMTHWIDTRQRFPYTDEQPARVEKMTAPNPTQTQSTGRTRRPSDPSKAAGADADDRRDHYRRSLSPEPQAPSHSELSNEQPDPTTTVPASSCTSDGKSA